ncbi:NAD(P)H-binding protein [Lentilactobacillus sp. Marseille-Q4993]|uniref:NAD(P)-dependent oxidoreductase n=1 Tax=Lentilactobacillus sp. Marseille-Q4993 TaxID=3039492 RepID=UPI0024BC4054|nr:NAD(P)H-binding protein [Lentilactobacillus sp. Marseille-Q4993]
MSLKIVVIGATGMAGSAITKDASKRGIDVTALVRNVDKAKQMFGDDVTYLKMDAFDLTFDDIKDFDVVVDAFAPGNQDLAHLHLELAEKLVDLVKGNNKPRLAFILGAASLSVGGGKILLDNLLQMPGHDDWIATPKAQVEEYRMLLDSEGVNWVAVSPSGTFKPGALTEFRLGSNTMLKNSQGNSIVYSETLAKALVDEIENPTHKNERFTVVGEE